jgi:hypothetical protein
MTDLEKQTFVNNFAAAWAARDGDAFLALWHPHGRLHYPFANRVIMGAEIGGQENRSAAKSCGEIAPSCASNQRFRGRPPP